jgi:hypothetical protein
MMPRGIQKIANDNGQIETAWHQYLAGIEDVSGRVAANMPALTAPPTQDDFNNLLSFLKAAGVMAKDS